MPMQPSEFAASLLIPPESLDALAKTLLRKIWITRGIRFEAKARYEQKQAASHVTTSILSIYVIAVALAQLFVGHVDAPATGFFFAATSIVAPIFILVLESRDAGKLYLVRAERMQLSAQRLQMLHSDLEMLIARGAVTEQSLEHIRREYQTILGDFSSNHENVDYEFFQARHPYVFGGSVGLTTKLYSRFARHANVWGFPILLVVVPGILIGIALLSLLRIS